MKKTLAIILAISLLCMMAVGTTLTYFTDEDSDVNTMTVGKVGITQKINGQNTGVVATTKLFPAVINGTTINNAVDMKVVATLEDGSEDAYVRTVYAFEMMKVGNDWVDPLKVEEKNGNEVATIYCVADQALKPTGVTITKGSTTYVIYVSATAQLTNETPAVTSMESLKQIYLGSQVGNEFADYVGNSYEVLVLSQAVQTQGFAGAEGKTAAQVALDTAFGEITVANADEIAGWFNN